ncbi:Stonustoxin subunit alpha [Labeo rohita]|uniref:Stonustoxin subunit alpha n=1 Tax=Labeo rohita TaxID=84645 RepID=A0A498NHD1_LABRO|nr:Stonustoxin subunit alpha [Labeo rohita]RXN34738.1 Stonustoxin subunit alpha [Labeo rohita]
MEQGWKWIIRLFQFAVDNYQKVSRANTRSKTKENTLCEEENVAHNIKKNWSRKIEGGSNKNIPMFKLNLDETWQNSDGFCRRITFGKNIKKGNKIIMMIGAIGAGKTTLINSMINYILGVQWEDDFRFVLIDEGKQKSQAESQTSEITAYQINHMDGFRVPYSLTIVDTPGFGDTRGISHDQKITKQIQEFFSDRGGIDRIDAVCFVVQASVAHLSDTQKYIFDSILSIFGKDIGQNIPVLVTFADGKTPPVVEAIKVSKVPCSTNESGEPLHFKFNNSALFAANFKSADYKQPDCENFEEMFWNLGFSSMKKFFTSLNTMETQSLFLTQEVLIERQQLEVYLQDLQPQINAGLIKLDEIKKIRAALKQNKAEMEANKDFEYELEVSVLKKIENNTGYYLTNCQQCHFTCHDTCIYANDRDKYMCMVMKNGKCTVCPGKCVWNVHINQKYKWNYVTEKRKETFQDLKKRYEDAHRQVMSKEKIFEELEKEFQAVQETVTKLIERSQKSLERLQEIALKPNPLSIPDYIDLMIESEKREAKPGFQDRIQSLMEVKKKAEIISKVSKGEIQQS